MNKEQARQHARNFAFESMWISYVMINEAPGRFIVSKIVDRQNTVGVEVIGRFQFDTPAEGQNE